MNHNKGAKCHELPIYHVLGRANLVEELADADRGQGDGAAVLQQVRLVHGGYRVVRLAVRHQHHHLGRVLPAVLQT